MYSARNSPVIWEPSTSSTRSEEHTSELQSHLNLVCRLLLEKKKTTNTCHGCQNRIGSQRVVQHRQEPHQPGDRSHRGIEHRRRATHRLEDPRLVLLCRLTSR